MASEDEIHPGRLSVDQIEERARYVVDDFGLDLSLEELDESIGVVMENAPGLELESTQEIRRIEDQEFLLQRLRSKMIPICGLEL